MSLLSSTRTMPGEYKPENGDSNSWRQSTIFGVCTLATQLLVRSKRKKPRQGTQNKSQPHTNECHIESAYPHKRRPRADHPHGRPVPIFFQQGHIEFVTLSLLLISLFFFLSILTFPCVASQLHHSPPRVAQARDLESRDKVAIPARAEKHSMSPSLNLFSTQNEDLVFEDSLDVQTNHYNETDQEASATVLLPASGSMRMLSHHEFDVAPSTAADNSRPNSGGRSESIHRLDLNSGLPHISSNHLTTDSFSDLAPRNNGLLHHTVNRDILPKRRGLGGLEVHSDLSDNSINNHNRDEPQHGLTPSNDTLSDPQSSIAGDHILRPFFRKDRKLREHHVLQKQQQLNQMIKPARPNKIHFRDQPDRPEWSVPVIELKRLNDRSRQEDNFKRLPLMGNEEGFILTGPNSSLQRREMLEKHKRSHNSVPKPKPKPELKRRFGELPNEPNSNHVPSGSSESHHMPHHGQPSVGGHDPFRMNYHIDDISINDLELDDVRPSRMAPTHPRAGNGNTFMTRKPIGSKPLDEQTGAIAPNSPSSPQQPSGEPLPQIMPLFFDKFLSEFEHPNAPLSPEGFALPPNQVPFDHSIPHQNMPQPPPSLNPIDSDLGDLDAPNHVERRLTNGNLVPHKNKPEIGPPLFSNEIAPTNEFENDFGSWPKIFRFTDGRINLHDFEREKKRARIKFSQKVSKSQALFNIKRESFLILHGGTFSH